MSNKIDFVIGLFEKDIAEFEKLLNENEYYNAPYSSENDYLVTCVSEESDLDSLNKFLEAVLELMNKNNFSEKIMYTLTPELTIDLCREEIKKIKKKKGKKYRRSYGFSNVAATVCIGLAAYHFLTDTTEMQMEFNRDRWESQGEYRSATKVAYTVSSENEGGKVHVNKYEPYDG